ncbi:MAG: exodeoxyribonuclease VII large subunit [Bifidobacteriaceae bacterium]|nr:exodeoxyribonuclease VII large subunit [Bifidobacteriaceae bacterium]
MWWNSHSAPGVTPDAGMPAGEPGMPAAQQQQAQPAQPRDIPYVAWGKGQIPRWSHDTTPDEPWPVGYTSHQYAGAVRKWPGCWMTGQIMQIDMRRRGSAYITLRDNDEDVSMRVVAFGEPANQAAQLGLRQGDKVVVYGRPDLWEKQTSLSFKAEQIRRCGEGDLAARIEELRRRLKGEGLFDEANKVPLPEFPRCIGLICAPGARAEGDVKTNASLRWPIIRFKTAYVKVQGPDCPREVIQAIEQLDADPDVDVIIVARGGGSFEDLVGFSDEGVVRATAACRTPIVSAIGHEDDWTLIELAADYRATTPTGAAQAVVPDVNEQWNIIAQARSAIDMLMDRTVRVEEGRLAGYLSNPMLTNPASMLDPLEESLKHQRETLLNSMTRLVDFEDSGIDKRKATLTALSPQSTLDRGYAIAQTADGHVIADPADVPDGSEVTVIVSRGVLTATKTAGSARES